MVRICVVSAVLLTACATAATPPATSTGTQMPRLHFDGNVQVTSAELDAVTVLDHPERKTDADVFHGKIATATQDGIEAAKHEAPPLERSGARNLLGAEGVALLSGDVLRMYELYYDRGYVTAQVAEPAVTLSKDGRSIDVAIHVNEGERYRIEHISLVDSDAAHDDPLLHTPIVTKDGDWFSRGALMKDVESLRQRYAAAGFANANFDPQTDIDVAHKTVSLVVEIHRAPQ